MKLLGALFLSFFLAFSAYAEESICLQTFNVYAPAYASNVEYRIGGISEALMADPCDIIQFQELWKDTHDNLLQEYMSSAEMLFLRADAMRQDQAIIGLSTAIKGRAFQAYSEIYRVNNENGFMDWIRNLSGVQKGFTAIEIKLEKAPQEILVLNTHTHPENPAIRTAQMIQLLSYYFQSYRGEIGAPIFFTADLNATPDSLEVALLRKVLLLNDAYLDVNKEYGKACTYCANNPLSWLDSDRVIDFNFYRSGMHLSLKPQSSVINLKGNSPEDPLSDHFGVRSYFNFISQEATLLDINDPKVLRRREEAAFTLQQAIDLMNHEDNEIYERSIEQAQALLDELKPDGQLSAQADFAFRLAD